MGKSNEIKELVRKLYFYCLPSSSLRVKYIKKHQIFDAVGNDFFFQPRKLPADPKFIRFHNNIAVAADVTFVNHDVIYMVLRNLDKRQNYEHTGCIEVMDNVFIGLGTIILPDVRIGPNAIIAAGSVITKDVPPNTVVGGVPAKVIGKFSTVEKKRLEEALESEGKKMSFRGEDRAKYQWEKFLNRY